jgi:hypothetical protein
MKAFAIILSFFLFQELPYKPSDEFEIKLNYQFKPRPTPDKNSLHFEESSVEETQRSNSDILPYLILNVKMLKLSTEEVRVRVMNNRNQSIISKKVETGQVIPIDLGFTADVKDRISPHEYILTFISPKKSETCKVTIHVDEDGTFLVNGEKRGKF